MMSDRDAPLQTASRWTGLGCCSMSAGPGTILEDDQQLYDWGIENRLDQYYQVQAEQWVYYVATVQIARL